MSTIKVTTYAELETFFYAFRAGKINLLIVQSRGGLSKTHTAEKLLTSALFFKGHSTPLSMYLTIHKEQPDLIVFDDVESLLENHRNTTILKALCDSKELKTIEYHTTARVNNKEIPTRIRTRAKTLILCNDLQRKGQDIKALLSRAIYLKFNPSVKEIITKLKEFATDKEILAEIENISHLCSELNLRIYTKTLQLKESKMDWKKYLYAMAFDDPQVVTFKQIESKNPGFTVKDKARLFSEITGKSTRQYHNIKRKMKK